jgi:hypothetical protein
MKHEYVFTSEMADQVLLGLVAIGKAIAPEGCMEFKPTMYVATENPRMALIIENLIGDQIRDITVRALTGPIPAEPSAVPEPVEERVIRIPKEPADPEPASRSNGHKPQKKTVSVETEPRFCAVCGDPVRGRRKVCEKDECIREMQRRYVRESAARKRAQKKAEAAEKEGAQEEAPAPFEEPIRVMPTWPTGTMWHCKSGLLAHQYLAPWELGEAVKDGKFVPGDLVEHKVRGEHIAVQEKDHLKFIPISIGRPEGA